VIDQDALLAVIAHSLLGSLSVCSGAVKTLRDHPDLSAHQRDELLRMAVEQADHMAEVLKDLMRGAPPEILEALDLLPSDPRIERADQRTT
jgi:K+-sensing histidine kinase KdpD